MRMYRPTIRRNSTNGSSRALILFPLLTMSAAVSNKLSPNSAWTRSWIGGWPKRALRSLFVSTTRRFNEPRLENTSVPSRLPGWSVDRTGGRNFRPPNRLVQKQAANANCLDRRDRNRREGGHPELQLQLAESHSRSRAFRRAWQGNAFSRAVLSRGSYSHRVQNYLHSGTSSGYRFLDRREAPDKHRRKCGRFHKHSDTQDFASLETEFRR